MEVLKEKVDMEDVCQALVLHQKDHQFPLWERDLFMEEVGDNYFMDHQTEEYIHP